MLHSGGMSQLRWLVRPFLWSGFDGSTNTIVRLRWSNLIILRDAGGLGIVDAKMHSRVILSKLCAYAFFLDNVHWKILLLSSVSLPLPRLGTCGYSWHSYFLFIFLDVPLCTTHLSPFMHSLLQIWTSMRFVLVRSAIGSLALVRSWIDSSSSGTLMYMILRATS